MKNNNKKKSIVLVAKAIGGMAFLAIFVMNIMTFVQKDENNGDLAINFLSASAQSENGECDVCQYFADDVFCIRFGGTYENGDPKGWVWTGNRIKCVAGKTTCTSTDCSSGNGPG